MIMNRIYSTVRGILNQCDNLVCDRRQDVLRHLWEHDLEERLDLAVS